MSLGTSSWLVAQDVLASAALPAIVLLAFWSADAGMCAIRLRFQRSPSAGKRSKAVHSILATHEDDATEGLQIRSLSVHNASGRAMLSEISFDVPPGSVTGILGESGVGKSLLLQAANDPFSLWDLDVRGNVTVNDHDVWTRHSQQQVLQVAYLPAVPILVHGSGRDNLSSFQDSFALDRAKRILEQLIFSRDLVDQICAADDARLLPEVQKKALAFARAFLMAPAIYLIDRPEDGYSDKQISALLTRMEHETRLGRSFLIATENRAIWERCDRLIILQDGRIVDYGEAAPTRARMAAGWKRFVGARRLDTEENLENWIRSHFKRDGDEANRRKVCMVASEMLALSCQGVSDANQQNLSFQFKHFEGH